MESPEIMYVIFAWKMLKSVPYLVHCTHLLFARFQFTVFINNRKARTGERVEVAIYGEPGAYVGLSGIDRAFYSMQAGNELSYSKVNPL